MDLRQPAADSPAEAAADTIAKIRQLTIFPGLPDEKSGALFFADLAALQQSQPNREVRENLIGAAIAAIEVCWASAEDELAALNSDLRRRPHAGGRG